MISIKCNMQIATRRGLVTVTNYEETGVNLMDLQVVVVDYEGIKWRETWHYVPFDTIEMLGLGSITKNISKEKE